MPGNGHLPSIGARFLAPKCLVMPGETVAVMSGHATVLLVEDEAMVRRAICWMLEPASLVESNDSSLRIP